MRPSYKFTGGKWKMARHYGKPLYDLVVEVFMGGAGFCHYWEPPAVLLIEKDPCIYGIMKFLIDAKPDDIRDIPIGIESIYCLPPGPVRDFVGMWFGRGDCKPRVRLTPSNLKDMAGRGATNYWGAKIRERTAQNVARMKHWEVMLGDYSDAPDVEAHWHIDPPYQVQGSLYKYGNSQIDYDHLREFSLSRRGSGEVCEGPGATWLQFTPLAEILSQSRDLRKELYYPLGKSNILSGVV